MWTQGTVLSTLFWDNLRKHCSNLLLLTLFTRTMNNKINNLITNKTNSLLSQIWGFIL